MGNIKKNQSPENSESENEVKEEKKPRKTPKRGIIYLSQIPQFMNVTKIREIFGEYGKVGRVYLELADHEKEANKITALTKKKPRKKPAKHFTEGWVEFERKKHAKQVALELNNKPVSTRKKSKFFDVLWNIKYLPRFKWVHLSERLAYEKAVYKQRLRAEIAQAKREANNFSLNVHRSKKLKKRQREGEVDDRPDPIIKQRKLDEEIRKEKGDTTDDRTEFLRNLFN